MTQFEAFKEACGRLGHTPEEIEQRISLIETAGFAFPGQAEAIPAGDEEQTIQMHYRMLKMTQEFIAEADSLQKN